MEIFIQDVAFSVKDNQLFSEIAKILHSATYVPLSPLPINFHIYLFKDRNRRHRHSGLGALTLPTEAIGQMFLREYSEIGRGRPSQKTLYIDNKKIRFSLSKRAPRAEIVETITRLPYIDPKAAEENEKRSQQVRSHSISIQMLQFGWECRDSVFSVEWEEPCLNNCVLTADDTRREFHAQLTKSGQTYVIAIRFAQIIWVLANNYLSQEPVIFMALLAAPSFELEISPRPNNPPFRQRLSALPFSDHERVAPYTSLAIRLICRSQQDLVQFRALARAAQLQNIYDDHYPVESDRCLFSSTYLDALEGWLRRLKWEVAFQILSMVRGLHVDIQEILSLRPFIDQQVKAKGSMYTSGMLRYFSAQVATLYWGSDQTEQGRESVYQCFVRSQKGYDAQSRSPSLKPTDGSIFDCYHVNITPTSWFCEGPFLEQSNRVIRSFSQHHAASFLRVSFVDESNLRYRFDREIDGPNFIRRRLGPFLLQGLQLAGRPFRFLAYSQSALKEHAVWFVKPFRTEQREYIDAPHIIRTLGTFENLEFDPQLIYCPARYAARLSQAFTATDASVAVEVEEIIHLKDITLGKWCFTDGVGTISSELAGEIWKQLKTTRRRIRRSKAHPKTFQVRFMGSKGMLSVDYKLKGRAICLRPSMIKFEAPESREIEICRAFDRPGRYFLNRPLIMLLEGLGVPYRTFKKYQDDAVLDAHQSTESLGRAARFLEAYGLGTSFRTTSVMLALEKLDLEPPEDEFYRRMMEFAINHVLRELKHHARIPVPGGWTLVGVADVHKYLKAGEIFACVKPLNSLEMIYLEGPTLISRSPTIHPGDVQIVRAIGRPPPGSCFAVEPLANAVVFSMQGDRPLPSCLGGGDLDGDVYNLIPLLDLPEFKPERLSDPSLYEAAPKKMLDRKSTMDDVAEFVMEYINSDVLGIVAISWLIIADQSKASIFDEDCFTLADLHSQAVDYQKSGQPVALSMIPRHKFRAKPDWNAPETVNPDTANFYQSQRAIGRLFRDISLPALREVRRDARYQRRQFHGKRWTVEELTGIISDMGIDSKDNESPIYEAVADRVSEFIFKKPVADKEKAEHIAQIYGRYVSELQTHCLANALPGTRSIMLTEEEAVIGTIVAKASQPRKRKDLMSKLREQTDVLVRGLREELAGSDDEPLEDALELAWLAWELSIAQGSSFGARSFGWVALGSIFETIKEIEDAQLAESRSRYM